VNIVDVPPIAKAFGGGPSDDPLDLIRTNADTIVRTGEKSWLQDVRVEPGC
jgi:hypothetical protein